MHTWTTLWLILAAVVLLAEALAIYAGTRATLSWQVWELRTLWWGRLLLVPFWAWMSWHFFIPQEGLLLGPLDDLILVGLAAMLTLLFLRYEPLDTP